MEPKVPPPVRRVFRARCARVCLIVFIMLLVLLTISFGWLQRRLPRADGWPGATIPEYNQTQMAALLLEGKCQDGMSVPPIVHYVRMSNTSLEPHEFHAIRRASRSLKPCYVMFHGRSLPNGRLWDRLVGEIDNMVLVRHENLWEEAFLRDHSVIMRGVLILEALRDFGGIYLDQDVYVTRDLNPLRNTTLTLWRGTEGKVEEGVILAHNASVFLKAWHLSYHEFNTNFWTKDYVEMGGEIYDIMPSYVSLMSRGHCRVEIHEGNFTTLRDSISGMIIQPKHSYFTKFTANTFRTIMAVFPPRQYQESSRPIDQGVKKF